MGQPVQGTMPTFVSPAAPGGGAPAPRPRDMEGCLVAYSPTEFTPAGAPGNTQGVGTSAPRDRVTADLYLLDSNGRAIAFGGSPEWDQQPKPHDQTVTGPARFTGVWVSNQNIVRALAPGGVPLRGQMVLGRIARSDVGQRPFNLVAVDGTPDMARAIQIWSDLQANRLPFNAAVPTPGMGAPAQQAPVVQYGQPAAPPNGYAQPVAPVPAPAPQVDAFAAWQAQQAAAAVPVAPPAPQIPPPPPGWTPQGWAQLTDDQRNQVLATITPAAQPQPGTAPVPPGW